MLLRFFLLILIIKKSMSATNDELKEELRLVRQDIGLLKVENKNQSDQITLLKGMVDSQNKIIDEKIVEVLNKKMKDCAMTGDDFLSPEQKQTLFRIIPPVHTDTRTHNCRLLATMVYDGVFKSKTLPENSTITSLGIFYGQPTSCSDLSQLGYTLNGFYVVKSNNESTNSSEIKLDNVFCAFKQPEGTFNSSLVEKRIVSRRETKARSKLIFHATMKKDYVVSAIGQTTLGFDKVLLNSGATYNEITAMFTVPQSGIYLFIFRGVVTFRQASFNRQIQISYFKNQGTMVGSYTVQDGTKSVKIEFDKMIKWKHEDKIQVDAFIYEFGAMFISGSSTSFTAYLLDE